MIGLFFNLMFLMIRLAFVVISVTLRLTFLLLRLLFGLRWGRLLPSLRLIRLPRIGSSGAALVGALVGVALLVVYVEIARFVLGAAAIVAVVVGVVRAGQRRKEGRLTAVLTPKPVVVRKAQPGAPPVEATLGALTLPPDWADQLVERE